MYLLHTYPDRFVVDIDGGLSHAASPPSSSDPVADSLLIDRASGTITRTQQQSQQRAGLGAAAFSERIDGIVGVMQSVKHIWDNMRSGRG